MNNKIMIFASAAVTFFVGAILVSEFPVIGSLVAFLEICAGFGFGFWYAKIRANEELTTYKNEITSLKNAVVKIAEEKSKIAKPIKVNTTKKTVAKAKPSTTKEQ